MLAYHGDLAVKKKYLKRVRAHRVADELTQRIGWKKGRGCAVGCTLDDYDHSRYPDELGVPVALAYLEDELFERQEAIKAQKWPERFLEAIPVGADLSQVWPQFAIWMLVDPDFGVIRLVDSTEIRVAVERVADLYRREGTSEEFVEAAKAAKAVGKTVTIGGV